MSNPSTLAPEKMTPQQQMAAIALGIINKASVQADDETQNAVAATKNLLKGIITGQLVVIAAADAPKVPAPPKTPAITVPRSASRAPRPGPAARMSK